MQVSIAELVLIVYTNTYFNHHCLALIKAGMVAISLYPAIAILKTTNHIFKLCCCKEIFTPKTITNNTWYY